LAATRLVLVYVGSSRCALAALLGGLLMLAICPLAGVLLTLGGVALSLYGTAGLCGVQVRRRQQEDLGTRKSDGGNLREPDSPAWPIAEDTPSSL
jgi:hypothetical protein